MFDSLRLIVVLLGTLIIFLWILKHRNFKVKIFFSMYVVMFTIYSGVGAALDYVDSRYIYYYLIFAISISIGISLGLKKNKNIRNSSKDSWNIFFDTFIEKHAKKIIALYTLVRLIPLIYPDNRIHLLFNPPMPDSASMLLDRFQVEQVQTFVTSLTSAIISIFQPFYLLSLYKYRNNILKILFIVFIPYYIAYCDNSYLGRSAIFEAAFIAVMFVFFSNVKWRKKIVIGLCCLFPTIVVAFLQYSVIRSGGEALNISTGDAMAMLFEQESGYPQWFEQILQFDTKYLKNYLVWLLSMPFPGFIRGNIDVNFTALFSEYVLGIYRGQSSFYIALPGVVGESVFLLGKYFFWINGILFGFLMGLFYRILSRYPQLLAIFVFSMFNFGYVGNRAGIFGCLPFFLKVLPYFYIIIFFIKKMSNQVRVIK